MVVIPTIIKNKEKVEELMKKLEVYYIANKSDNIYFTLLGDCSGGSKEKEELGRVSFFFSPRSISSINLFLLSAVFLFV